MNALQKPARQESLVLINNYDDSLPQPTPLDYPAPEPGHRQPVLRTIAALFGGCAGLAGASALVLGVHGKFTCVRNVSADFAQDLFGVSIVLLIAAICVVAAHRWCRAAARLFAGR